MPRFIPTKVHGVIDYAAGATFLASPWLFGFADKSAATYVPVGMGAAALGISLLTDYELGAIRKIPMKSHLAGDVAQGVTFLAAPYVFGFAHRVKWPHLLFGALALGAGLLTRTQVGR